MVSMGRQKYKMVYEVLRGNRLIFLCALCIWTQHSFMQTQDDIIHMHGLCHSIYLRYLCMPICYEAKETSATLQANHNHILFSPKVLQKSWFFNYKNETKAPRKFLFHSFISKYLLCTGYGHKIGKSTCKK